MRYWKSENDGYISTVGTGDGGVEIVKAEYDNIMTAISNKPQSTDTRGYRLKTDLTWEEYQIEPSDEIDDSEALEILLGGAE